MLTSLVLLTLGSIGYNIYKATRKKPAPAIEDSRVDDNDLGDDNHITTEEDNE